MRLLIAGGGTGGHIYPALAVARSLRERPDRPNAPELVWLGGHRGLEAELVRDAGIRVRRLALRSLRTVDRSVHTVLDPIRLGLSVPQAAAILVTERPAAIFTTGGYVAVPVVLAAAPLRIPVVLWEGNAIPGRAVRAIARLADALAVSYEAAGRALAARRRADVRDRDADPRRRAITGAAARARLDLPPDAPVVLIFGGSQAVRRFNAAVAGALPRLVERVHVLHVSGETRLRRRARRAGAAARPSCAIAIGPTRSCATTCSRPSSRPISSSAGPGSSTLAEVTALGIPSVIVPYPHAGAHQGANAAILAAAGAARVVADEAFDADALVAATDILFDEPARTAMAAAARGLGRPGAADAVAALVLALADAPAAAGGDAIERDRARARPRDAGPAGSDAVAAFDALALGTAIQRRIGVKTSRDEPLARFTTMRVGGPADLFATVHNVHELRAIVRFALARIPLTLLGGGADPRERAKRTIARSSWTLWTDANRSPARRPASW